MQIDQIWDVSCPRCGHEGPHERIEVHPSGEAVTASCGDNLCCLRWLVRGPEKMVSS